MAKKRKPEQRFSEYYAGLDTADKIAYLEAMLQALRRLPSALPLPNVPQASPGDLAPATIEPPQPPELSQNVQQQHEAQPRPGSRTTKRAAPKPAKRSRRR